MVNKHKQLGVLARIVLFLRTQGFSSAQIRYICTKILRIKGPLIHKKIALYSKNIEITEAIRRWDKDDIGRKMYITGLVDELNEWKKGNK